MILQHLESFDLQMNGNFVAHKIAFLSKTLEKLKASYQTNVLRPCSFLKPLADFGSVWFSKPLQVQKIA
jgi:hypothetical protein